MLIKKIKSRDNLILDYYIFGDGSKTIFINNAPGMSIKFWIPIINNLIELDYKIFSMEYRGFQSSQQLLTEQEADFDKIVDDVIDIIELEGLKNVHLLSWCVGAKVSLHIYQRAPEHIKSLCPLNCGFTKHDLDNLGTFPRLMYSIDSKVEESPEYLNRMIKIMKEMGTLPTTDFLKIMGEKESESPAYNLYNYLDGQSPLASLSFYLIDDPVNFRNYLKIYKSFGNVGADEIIKNIKCPLDIINAETDNMINYGEYELSLVNSNDFINYTVIEGASHFMLIDLPRRVSKKIHSKLMIS